MLLPHRLSALLVVSSPCSDTLVWARVRVCVRGQEDEVLPSDSRFREDLIALKKGPHRCIPFLAAFALCSRPVVTRCLHALGSAGDENADKQKVFVEERQRADRRKRQEYAKSKGLKAGH